MFYIAQYPVRWTAQSALHFTPGRPVHSDTNSTYLGSISNAAITARRLFIYISTAVYTQVLIYTAERTGASWRTKIPKLRNSSKGIRTRAISIESGILPPTYRAPQIISEVLSQCKLRRRLTSFFFCSSSTSFSSATSSFISSSLDGRQRQLLGTTFKSIIIINHQLTAVYGL